MGGGKLVLGNFLGHEIFSELSVAHDFLFWTLDHSKDAASQKRYDKALQLTHNLCDVTGGPFLEAPGNYRAR